MAQVWQNLLDNAWKYTARTAEPKVRVDSFAHDGCAISPYYDSLVAKLMAHGRDRKEAIARMRRCLDVMVVDGIKTNIPLHQELCQDAAFLLGGTDIHYLEKKLRV